MGNIPKQTPPKSNRIDSNARAIKGRNNNIVFSFDSLVQNKYFNLDATCQNWSSDLFEALKLVSNINVKEVYAGSYSGKNTTLRIHNHSSASPPCDLPPNVELDDFWQIRISRSKGGIHGVFSENVFYVMWLDPQHNMYPDNNHGGLKVLKAPTTCCKDREVIIEKLSHENKTLRDEIDIYTEWMDEIASAKPE